MPRVRVFLSRINSHDHALVTLSRALQCSSPRGHSSVLGPPNCWESEMHEVGFRVSVMVRAHFRCKGISFDGFTKLSLETKGETGFQKLWRERTKAEPRGLKSEGRRPPSERACRVASRQQPSPSDPGILPRVLAARRQSQTKLAPSQETRSPPPPLEREREI